MPFLGGFVFALFHIPPKRLVVCAAHLVRAIELTHAYTSHSLACAFDPGWSSERPSAFRSQKRCDMICPTYDTIAIPLNFMALRGLTSQLLARCCGASKPLYRIFAPMMVADSTDCAPKTIRAYSNCPYCFYTVAPIFSQTGVPKPTRPALPRTC